MVSLCGRGFEPLHLHNYYLGHTMRDVIRTMGIAGLCLLLLNSCEKIILDQEKSTTKAVGNVVLTVDGVEAFANEAVTRGEKPVEQVCSRLCFAVYQDGQRVKYDNQKLGDSGYGSTTMTLDEGHYQLLILGHSGNANPTTTKPNQIKFSNVTASGGTGFTDTFYYYGDLEVSGNMNERGYTLERATAMLRFMTEDGKPSNVKRFYFYYTGGSAQLDVTTGSGNANSQQKVYFELDESTDGEPRVFELYTFPHSNGQQVTFKVEAQDANGTALYTKEVKAVMERNMITQFSGNFFTGGNPDNPDEPGGDNTSSSIMVDTTWGGVEEYSY